MINTYSFFCPISSSTSSFQPFRAGQIDKMKLRRNCFQIYGTLLWRFIRWRYFKYGKLFKLHIFSKNLVKEKFGNLGFLWNFQIKKMSLLKLKLFLIGKLRNYCRQYYLRKKTNFLSLLEFWSYSFHNQLNTVFGLMCGVFIRTLEKIWATPTHLNMILS